MPTNTLSYEELQSAVCREEGQEGKCISTAAAASTPPVLSLILVFFLNKKVQHDHLMRSIMDIFFHLLLS